MQKALAKFLHTEFTLADPSREMLNEAKKKLYSIGGDRVRFLEPAATQDLKETLQSFDVITAMQSHHYNSADERAKATNVCFNLLRQGGLYVTFENIRPFTNKGIELGKENWRNFQLEGGRDSIAVQKFLERLDVEYHPVTLEDHFALLRHAGFSTVEMVWYSCMQAGFYGIK